MGPRSDSHNTLEDLGINPEILKRPLLEPFGAVIDFTRRGKPTMHPNWVSSPPLYGWLVERFGEAWRRERDEAGGGRADQPYLLIVGGFKHERLMEISDLDQSITNIVQDFFKNHHGRHEYGEAYCISSYLVPSKKMLNNLFKVLYNFRAENRESQPAPNALDRLERLYSRVTDLRNAIRQDLHSVLAALSDRTFPSIDAMKEVTDRIQVLLDIAGLAVQCPHCKEPSILRCYPVGNARRGAFQFKHRAGRTRHGGRSAFPSNLVLMPAPPDGRRGPKQGRPPTQKDRED